VVRFGGRLISSLTRYPRVAFLPDTFHEVNGVAHTSRHLEAFARRSQIPFLSVHAGPTTELTTDGNVTILQLARSPASFELDANLDYDPFLCRHASRVCAAFEAFKPDLIHLTGPGDMGALGTYLSLLMGIPTVISWHTSLHQYAGHRLERVTGFLGQGASQKLGSVAEEVSLQILRAFYWRADMIMAPNQELIDLTRNLTGKPVYLMRRGVDTVLFNPTKRTRTSELVRIGYVGRLTPEKNVRFLAELAKGLSTNVEFVIVGEGSERDWLQGNIPNAGLTGVLRGEQLAQAYADMDLFVFPSTTDTFGNVILEALASGLPCVVTNEGGPKFLINEGLTGHIATDSADFISFVSAVSSSVDLRRRMGSAARNYALSQSWDTVFEEVFAAYATRLPKAQAA
jgi:phosphatidylinositol alpha 1,6-mannosyltransferase